MSVLTGGLYWVTLNSVVSIRNDNKCFDHYGQDSRINKNKLVIRYNRDKRTFVHLSHEKLSIKSIFRINHIRSPIYEIFLILLKPNEKSK